MNNTTAEKHSEDQYTVTHNGTAYTVQWLDADRFTPYGRWHVSPHADEEVQEVIAAAICPEDTAVWYE